MIRFIIITLFPEIFNSFKAESLLKKAGEKDLLSIETVNIKDFGIGKHKKVDSPPYGGGAGMVLRPEPTISAIRYGESKIAQGRTKKILLTPQGRPFKQSIAKKLAAEEETITLICGRYEGFDERIRSYVDDEISIGDFVMLGGEVAAMAIIESVSRLVPGVIGNQESLDCESFNNGLLEAAQYTRPNLFEGHPVPDVLQSGNHKAILDWRQSNSILKTKKLRPDLLA